MFIERADAGNAQQGLQLVEKTRLVIAGKIDCGGSHSLCLSGAPGAHIFKMTAKAIQYTGIRATLCGEDSPPALNWQSGSPRISIHQSAVFARSSFFP